MEKKKKKSEKKAIRTIVLIAVFFVCCVGFGVLIGKTAAGTGFGMHAVEASEGNPGAFLMDFAIFYIEFLVAFFLHIIVHEAGHLVFGKLSGYRFVSFRIGSILWQRENGKLVHKKFSIPGTGGQCLMAPPRRDEKGDFPTALYNMGGILMNVIVAVLALIVGWIIGFDNVAGDFCFMLILGGLLVALTNGIPMKVGGVSNDGYNLFYIKKDPISLNSFYVQLEVNALATEGVNYGEMDLNLVKVEEGADLANPLISAQKIMEYQYYLDRDEQEQAKVVLDQLDAVYDDLTPVVQFLVAMEEIFLEAVGQARPEVVRKYFTKNVQKMYRKFKYEASSKRCEYARLWVEGATEDELEKAYEDAKRTAEGYPVKADKIMNLRLLEELKNSNKNN